MVMRNDASEITIELQLFKHLDYDAELVFDYSLSSDAQETDV